MEKKKGRFTHTGAVILYPYETDEIFNYIQEYPEPPELCRQERRLLRAILMRAILDASGNSYGNEAGQQTSRNARAWIREDSDPEQPFSYIWICDQLDLNPQVLRDLVIQAEEDKTPLFRSVKKHWQGKNLLIDLAA